MMDYRGDFTEVDFFDVMAPDGLRLSARRAGSGDCEILFVHGFSQAALAFSRQFTDPVLCRNAGLVAFDLRGHGASDKPVDAARYGADEIWADDLQAVMDRAGLVRPVLVAWSYGARVVADYVRKFGTSRIAGVNFVSGFHASHDPALFGPAMRHFAGMVSADVGRNISASRAFVHDCHGGPAVAEDVETMLAMTMMVPPLVRRHVLKRADDRGDALAGLDVPVLFSHGTSDRVFPMAMSEFALERVAASASPLAHLSCYEGDGHLPFAENPQRFNAELLAFARGTGG